VDKRRDRIALHAHPTAPIAFGTSIPDRRKSVKLFTDMAQALNWLSRDARDLVALQEFVKSTT